MITSILVYKTLLENNHIEMIHNIGSIGDYDKVVDAFRLALKHFRIKKPIIISN